MQIPRDKIKIVLIYIILILLNIKFILLPSYRALSEKKESWQKLTKNYETLLVLEKEVEVKGVKEENNAIPYFLESSPMVYSILLGIIKNLTQQMELQLLHYEIIESKRGEGRVEEVPLFVKITGRPVQIYNLLKALSKHPKIINVRSLEIKETEQGYEAILNISAFRYSHSDLKTEANSTKRDEKKIY